MYKTNVEIYSISKTGHGMMEIKEETYHGIT